MNTSALRKNLIELLEGGRAHVTVKQSLAGLSPKNRNIHPSKGMHSVWEEFEHMRISQEDILRYTLDPSWISPPWPEGYWPGPEKLLTASQWSKSVRRFFADLKEFTNLVKNPHLDLTAEIPHGKGQTYLREILLAADHNAYHTGQIVQIRKRLGDWGE